MKNTDFDYIKDKFDKSEVNSPEEINEEYVIKKISAVQPIKVKKSKKKIIGIVSAAAVFALVTAVSVAIAGILGGLPFGTNPFKSANSSEGEALSVEDTAKLTKFSNYSEVNKAVKMVRNFNARLNDYYGTEDAPKGFQGLTLFGSDIGADDNASESAQGYINYNSTNVQHEGVDEADTVKTDGKYIYYLSVSGCIEVFSTDEKNSKKVAQIEADPGKNERFEEFYICGKKLIVLSNLYVSVPKKLFSESEYKEMTEVNIYDISDVDIIELTDSFTQGGCYCSSRMIDGMLYVVSTQYCYDEDELPFVYEDDATNDEAAISEVPADCIYSVENPTDPNFLVISSINTDISAQATITKAILGSADEVYCNQENLYVTAGEYDLDLYEAVINNRFLATDIGVFPSVSRTQIVKVSLENDIDFTATTRVEGWINDQYSLDEYNGNLRAATTSVNEDGLDINNLYVLDKNLNKLGEVTGFAEDESIKAVRYVGDTAYVITYEQTDPLFVIDVSEPTAPKITGEVKISGFSTMLVPIDNNTLLGIGYHTSDDEYIDMEVQDGLKLVTFDVSDKNEPKVIDTKILENCESQVQYNPKALLVNSERGDFTIPINYNYSSENDEYTSPSGVLNFRVDNGKIIIIDEYISEEFDDEYYGGVDRCVYVEDYIYMLGITCDEKYDYYGYSYKTNIDCVKYK